MFLVLHWANAGETGKRGSRWCEASTLEEKKRESVLSALKVGPAGGDLGGLSGDPGSWMRSRKLVGGNRKPQGLLCSEVTSRLVRSQWVAPLQPGSLGTG